MATKVAVRYVARRFSSGGKILSEEEKAAENIYIKKMEQESFSSIARKGQKAGVSTDKSRSYAVLAGFVTGIGALGWYLKSKNRVLRLHLETLSTVIELNNNKRSVFFCSEVHVGHDGTIKRFSLIPRAIGPAGPNENLTEIAKKSKTEEPATENGEANDLMLVALQGKTAGVSTDKNIYYAGVVGNVTGLGALVWYFEKIWVSLEIVSMVRELNQKRVRELNKHSGISCYKVHVGPHGTTMEFSPAGPNENLTENGNEDENGVVPESLP